MTRIIILYLFLLPFTRVGLPVGIFKMTASDLLILSLFIVVICKGVIKDILYPFAIIFAILLASVLSILNVSNLGNFILNLLPFVLGLVQMAVIYALICSGRIKRERLVKGIVMILWFYAVCGILEVLGLMHIGYFYVDDAYRLSGPTANPNAFVMYIVTLYAIVIFANLTNATISRTLSITGPALLPTVVLTGSITGSFVICAPVSCFFHISKLRLAIFMVSGLLFVLFEL